MVALRDGLRWATQGAWVQDLPAGFQWLGLTQAAYPFVALCHRRRAAGRARLGAAAPGGRPRDVRDRIERARRAAGRLRHGARSSWRCSPSRGALTGLAALLNAVRFNQIPSNAGIGLEMKVIAAVVVGGAAVRGGPRQRARHAARRRPARRDRPGADVPRRERVLGARDAGRDHPGRGRDRRGSRPRPRRVHATPWRDARHDAQDVAATLVSERRMDRCCSRSPPRSCSSPAIAPNFFTVGNFFEITRLSVELGLLAVALTPVIVAGGIDLSVGSMMGLAAVVFGAAYRDWHLPLPLAAALRAARRLRRRRAERAADRAARAFRRSS